MNKDPVLFDIFSSYLTHISRANYFVSKVINAFK